MNRRQASRYRLFLQNEKIISGTKVSEIPDETKNALRAQALGESAERQVPIPGGLFLEENGSEYTTASIYAIVVGTLILIACFTSADEYWLPGAEGYAFLTVIGMMLVGIGLGAAVFGLVSDSYYFVTLAPARLKILVVMATNVLLLSCSGYLLSIVVSQYVEHMQRESTLSALLNPHIETYTNEFSRADEGGVYVRGKVVFLYWKHYLGEHNDVMVEIDKTPPFVVAGGYMSRYVASSLLPEKAEQVGTAIWMDQRLEIVGRYTRGGTARVAVTDYQIIDLHRRVVLCAGQIWGGDAPSSTNIGYGTGDAEESKLAEQINQLPRIALGQNSGGEIAASSELECK